MSLIRIIFLPFIIILAFFALMFLALCGEIYEWSGDMLCFLSLHKWKYAVDSKSKLRDKFDGDCFFRECQRPKCTATEERDDYHY